MKPIALGLAVWLCCAAGASAAEARFTDKLRIRRVESSYAVNRDSESLVIREVASSAGPFLAAERRVRTTRAGTTLKIVHEWIDGRRCPALGELYASMPKTWAAPDRDTPVPFHGTRVTIFRVGIDAGHTGLSDYEGRVTGWLRIVEQIWSPCWTQDRPMVDDALLPLTLETDSDEADYIALLSPD